MAFLETINIGSSQFAEEIGVQPSGISHILSGRNHPSLDFVLKVLKRYPDLSTEWLLFGKGNMYGSSDMASGNQRIVDKQDVNSERAPDNLSGLFAGIEGAEPRSMERSGEELPDSDESRDPGTDREKGHQISSYSVDNKYTDGNNVIQSSGRIAERLILIYGDGTFEQLSLSRDSSKNPGKESDK